MIFTRVESERVLADNGFPHLSHCRLRFNRLHVLECDLQIELLIFCRDSHNVIVVQLHELKLLLC